MEMQEKASQSPWDGGDTEGGNGRRAMGHCILIHISGVYGNTDTVLAEGGMGSAGKHNAELY